MLILNLQLPASKVFLSKTPRSSVKHYFPADYRVVVEGDKNIVLLKEQRGIALHIYYSTWRFFGSEINREIGEQKSYCTQICSVLRRMRVDPRLRISTFHEKNLSDVDRIVTYSFRISRSSDWFM